MLMTNGLCRERKGKQKQNEVTQRGWWLYGHHAATSIPSTGKIKTVGGHQGICMVADKRISNTYCGGCKHLLWWLYICGIQLKRLYPRSEFEPLLLGLLRLH